MEWQVLWSRHAEELLAACWLDSTDPASITRASYEIDAQLRRNPFAQSESRAGHSRIMFNPPLIVDYRVNEDEKKVLVQNVRDMTRRS